MSSRFLFGPVNGFYADQFLYSHRQSGQCLAFDLHDGADLTIALDDTWADVISRFPASWQPDFIALYLPYQCIPNCLWSAPVPIVGLAPDWNLLHYHECLPACDLVLTDTVGVETLKKQGLLHAQVANLFGLGRTFLEKPSADVERDIDILFVGRFNTAIHRERTPWLGRVAALAERWKVMITKDVYGEEYRALLNRARIVFNRGIRGECNMRAFEATAAGALLFQEAENREISTYFTAGAEFVAYGQDDLETLLTYYLEHEDQRGTIAEEGRRRAQHYSFGELWQTAVDALEPELAALPRQPKRPLAAEKSLQLRSWQALGDARCSDKALAADLQRAIDARPTSATLRHALATTLAMTAKFERNSNYSGVVKALREALELDPTHAVACLNLAELLAAAGQKSQAVEQAREGLAILDRNPVLGPEVLDAAHVPVAFDIFRVEWERAAWSNAGQPALEAAAKRALITWRLHSLLAALTGQTGHFYEAAIARPDLPSTRGALGCALARAGKLDDAGRHLRPAIAGDPFDNAAARALFKVLGELGETANQNQLARERRLLARAAPTLVPQEAWFAEAAAESERLASLIILCCNQLEYTRQCLESVLQHTRWPYELLLIDNGSTDGTPDYLEQLRHRPEPARVVVIRNETNLGFAAGCNQGLAQSRGGYLVLLNNDTIVTPGWLDGLIPLSQHDWPQVGLVGPMTNCASPPQEVPASYRTPEELVEFAANRRQEFAGKAVDVKRLIGFCMLFRRDVWEKLGGLDEGFGLGFFEDDDLCVRVREAGFRLVMALNVFVHHFGSRTFRGLGIDAWAQLRTNFEKFRAKWGDERCVGYRLPDPPGERAQAPESAAIAPSQSNRARPRVSLCMIVKNEERHLATCLASVVDLVDEMIVVDTGSTDSTKEIARQAGARVIDFVWVDSFAAARNESLRHANGDWILWLDADERLDDGNRQRLRNLISRLKDENMAYVMRQFSKLEAGTHGAAQVDQVRLFRNRPDIRWQYRVHEQILLAVRRTGGNVCITDIVIDHAGFSEATVQGPKVDRNMRLLELELAEHPNDSFVLYNLGAVRLTQGQISDALELLQRSLDSSKPGDVLIRKLHALITRAHHQLGNKAEALEVCRSGLAAFAGDGELLFWEAMLLREQKDVDGAAACLQRVLKGRPSQHFTSVDAGLYGYRARHLLGEIYRDQGKLTEAEAQWQAAVAENPEFTPGWLELAKLYVGGKRWPELDQAFPHLERDPMTALEALVIRGRAHLERGEFAAAKEDLLAAIGRAPKAVLPRVLLSHALLKEGIDWLAAQKALRDVLAIEPGNREAQHNLKALQLQHPYVANAPSAVIDWNTSSDKTAEQAAAVVRPRVSLCMIVRNEEDNLGACLESVEDLVDEMIVVDTGSTDRTKEIAVEHGAKVYDFPWIDHFAAARNESLRHATGDWILWLDADDRLDAENRAKLRVLISGLNFDRAGYVMKCLCLPDSSGVATVVDHLRLFRKHPRAKWTFRVHEQILPSLRDLRVEVRWSEVVIHHTGYQNQALRQCKLQRDLRLLQLEQVEQPNHPFTLFNLGSVYQELGRLAEALGMFHRSLELSAPHDSIVRKLYALIAQCSRQLGQKSEALVACDKGLSFFTDDTELVFQKGVTLRETGDLAGAIACWESCLETAPEPHFASVNTGLRGHITRHNLAGAYLEQGRAAQAEEQWKKALEDRPGYEPAWRGLLTRYLEQQRWQDVDTLAKEIEGGPMGLLQSSAIRARLYLARKEFDVARRVLEDAVERWPESLEPRVLLSHSLLKEGKDWRAAEMALREVLRLDPDHAESKHNLGLLVRQRASA